MVTTMNGSSGGGGGGGDDGSDSIQQQTITISSVTSNNNNALVVEHSLDDDDDDGMSDDSSPGYDNGTDLMHATMEDEVTAQLAAAGPVGMAAAAAIASAKKRKRPHQFETNPSIRKRQQTRLLRKLRQTIDEFTIRVGMQAVVLVAIPGKPQNSFKCFGAKPLEDVIRNLRPVVMQDLESALAQHAPAPAPEDPTLHELPPLVIDGIPTPVEKMTQAQLRAFIPLMLKYSTGRGKPGWGKESTRPPWWPQDLPWANVRMDARTEDEKQKVSWTHALRQIVINCYKYHGREDLLPVFNADSEEASNNNNTLSSNVHNSSNNTASPNNVDVKPPPAKIPKASPQNQIQQIQTVTAQAIPQYGVVGAHGFQPTVLQTISNPDGTVSIIQVDPTNSIITLPDGTTAQVQGLATLQQSSGGDGHHHHHQDDSHHHHTTHHQLIQQQDLAGMTVDLNSVAQATLGQEGQIILTGEDGHAYPVTVSGMITVPVNASMYQTVVANISSVQQPDGSMQTKFLLPSTTTTTHIHQPKHHRLSARQTVSRVVTPMVLPKVEPGTEHETTTIPVSALTGDPTQTQLVTVNANGQVVHDNKIYQICEFLKAENQEKVIMMAEVTPSTSHHHQQQSQGQDDQQQQVQSKDTSNSSSGSPSSVPSDQQQQSIGVSEQQQQSS